jgi:hypothetical protein
MSQDRKAPDNQGEGNREAARHYNDAQHKFAESGKVDKAAEDAKKAIDGPEAQDLKDAEREGLKPARH